MDAEMSQTEEVEPLDERRPYVLPELSINGKLDELVMTPTFLLEAYG